MDASCAGANSVLELESLIPRYSEEQHGTYYAILKRAIDEQPDVRNIAVAGPYGVGKSSVLEKVAEVFDRRVIKISLLTLGGEHDRGGAAKDANPVAQTTSNRIQKEIVKQLLYQQRPSETPESRFRRIARLRWQPEIFIALGAGAMAVLLLIAAGLDVPAMATGEPPTVVPPQWLRTMASYLVVMAVTGLLVLIVRMLIQGRLGIEKVTAGPATITLPPRSTSYFDEYLDEIIYFFETNAGRDIVILEDLDRFDDAGIFESLRSLNGLLNSARQLEPRNFRFIYAVRDSVFENLGRDTALATTDDARAELVRANRTKFFELIVPVVPFITHKNARDLMYDLLKERGHHTVSKDLVHLAARHVADMRLIHNIVNEYEVFHRRLLAVPNPVPQLDPERLFALVVFKNAHMADFERIRQGTSSLDRLFETWRLLVGKNLRDRRESDASLLARIENQEAMKERATELAEQLRARIAALADAPGSGLVNGDVHLADSVIDDETLTTPAFWRDLVQNNRALTLQAHSGSQVRPRSMKLSVQALETLLDTSLELEPWAEHSVEADHATMRRNRADAEFLVRHTWQQLVNHPQYTYASATGETSRTFRQWIEHLLPSRLATDLVTSGYITSYFSLHVSAFYGQLIREAAMSYVMRHIDHGTADPDYLLDAEDVEAILRDQGKSVLGERSMYNVSILDHLLVTAPQDAAVIVNRLAGAGADEWAFIDHYVSAGRAKDRFIAQLTRLLPDVYTYLVERAPVEREVKTALLDTAIAHRSPDLGYELTDTLRSFLEANYGGLASLTRKTDPPSSPVGTVAFIVDAGAAIPDVAGLTAAAYEVLARTRAYRLTAQNLEHLAGSDDIALDVLAQAPREIYTYAVDHLEEYLRANSDSPRTRFTINAPEAFAEVLNASESWRKEDFDRLVERAHPGCQLRRLDEAPHPAWPALVQSRRVPATFSNTAAYVEWHGEVDTHLAALLSGVDRITEVDGVADPDRRDLTLAIVNAGHLMSDTHRIKLARTLKPGLLPTSSIEPESGRKVGRLIAARLMADDGEAFDKRLMVDWETQEFAITSSRKYIDMVGPETLQPAHIAPLMRSRKIDKAVQQEVADTLSDFSAVPKDSYQALAECALASRVSLTATGIDMVRRGGADTASVVRLLAQAGDRITTDELREVLRNLRDPYSIIADKGTQRPSLPDTPVHRAILDRLESEGIVSQYKAAKGSTLRAYLNRV